MQSSENVWLKPDTDIYEKAEDKSQYVEIYHFKAKQTVKTENLGEIQSYRDKLEDKGESPDQLTDRKGELISGEFLKPPEMLMGMIFGIELGKGKTLEERSSDLLKKYAEKYDEIMQGYKNGDRERFVYDSASESGYRKVTMEEELGYLNEAFKNAAEFMERIEENTLRNAKTFESIANSMAKSLGEESEMALKARDAALRAKNAVIPEDISGKIIAAANVFAREYSKQTNINLESILKNITIFSS